MKEDMWTENKHMKISSTALVIREMQIKTTVRYHYILIRMANFKRLTTLVRMYRN